MIPYNGTICISKAQLVRSDDNPNGVLSLSNYDYYVRKGQLKIMRRGGGEGNSTLLAFESVPPKYKKKYKEVNKIDPNVEAQKTGLLKDIEIKTEAVDFFKLHRIIYSEDKQESLPDEVQELYVNNAAVLDALKIAWDKHVLASRSKNKRPLTGEFWKNAAAATQRLLDEKKVIHDLPKNQRRLQEKLKEYTEQGYACLISKKYANQNSRVITEEVGAWLVSRFSSRIEIVTLEQLFAEYNLLADSRKWDKLKSVKAVKDYLYLPEVKPLWYAARYGELASKEEFSRQNRRKELTRRDTLWYSDGTKLNYFYRDEKGNVKTCNVYEVIDAYSECFLGYHISQSEDYEAQYYAFKMALQTAGHKPYELKYDNQGGHKKLESSNLLQNLARHAVKTAPYNGKSKTIESAFGRFQAQFLHKEWYFTGQNITATKKESRANMEFILANTDKLPTLDEIKAKYVQRRTEWNNAAHPKTGISRIEMYRTSVNEETQAVDYLDMISIFGVTTKDPATYRASGIEIQVKRKKYAYEVLDENGMPDMNFYRNNIGRRFYTRYCPDDMSIVSLYEKDAQGGMRFVTMAQTFVTVAGNLQDQTSEDLRIIRTVEHANKQMRIDREKERNDLLAAHGMHPNQHGLNVAPIKGVNTSKAKKGKIDIGELQKEISNMTAIEAQKKAEKRIEKAAAKATIKQEANEQRDFNLRRLELLQQQLN